ncbi:MAG: SDR family NAD(P)-dependent oxidoreductase [Alphaproteobacteria bacterium]
MQGKTVAVTGAAKGIGRSIAEVMAAKGARLALIDKDKTALDATVADLNAQGHQAVGIEGDITRREACQRAFAACVSAYGRIDSLVNNAGLYIRTPIDAIDDREWDLIFDVCLRGVFHMSVAAATHMRAKGGGRIVNIASVDGFVAFPAMAHYAAAKAGVISLTKSFAIAYADDKVLVNAVAPGATNTPPMRENDYLAKLSPRIPLKRGAEPQEIAEAVCFLAGDANTYCTGETMIVSGGLVIA